MYFLLGAMVAALLAMFTLPALWRRAVRLTRARLEQSLPLNSAEIAAEKDQLRAQFAVDLRRVEQTTETAQLALQRAKSQVGDQLLALQHKEAALASTNEQLTQSQSSLAAAQSLIAQLETDVSNLIRERDNLSTLLAAARISNQALEQDASGARTLADQRQSRLVDIESQFESIGVRLNESQAMVGDLRESIRQKTEELRTAARAERDAANEHANMERKLLAAESISEDRARALEALQVERIRLIDENGQVTRERDAEKLDRVAHARELDAVRVRLAELEAEAAKHRQEMQTTILDLTRSADQARHERRALADEISALRFNKVRLETDLARLKQVAAQSDEISARENSA